jgi:hypothetical protein
LRLATHEDQLTDKPPNLRWLIQMTIQSGHDEADDTFKRNTKGMTIARSDTIRQEGAKERAWNIEEVDDSIVVEALPQPGLKPAQLTRTHQDTHGELSPRRNCNHEEEYIPKEYEEKS